MKKKQSPFKFLDAYTQEDEAVFFGREKETGDLYNALSGVKHLLVYGPSGAGKTSLIECGLRNQFSDADWFTLSIRRGNNINASVFARINEALDEKIKIDPETLRPKDENIQFGQAIELLFEDSNKQLKNCLKNAFNRFIYYLINLKSCSFWGMKQRKKSFLQTWIS